MLCPIRSLRHIWNCALVTCSHSDMTLWPSLEFMTAFLKHLTESKQLPVSRLASNASFGKTFHCFPSQVHTRLMPSESLFEKCQKCHFISPRSFATKQNQSQIQMRWLCIWTQMPSNVSHFPCWFALDRLVLAAVFCLFVCFCFCFSRSRVTLLSCAEYHTETTARRARCFPVTSTRGRQYTQL